MLFVTVKDVGCIWSVIILRNLSFPPAVNKVGVIVGAVIGALLLLLLLLLLILLLVCCCCCKRRFQKEAANEIRYWFRDGSCYWLKSQSRGSSCLTPVWSVSSGRTPRPRRADPPAGTPACVQSWATAPTMGCNTALWGTTCPVSGNLAAVLFTHRRATGPRSRTQQRTNLLPFITTIDTDTLSNCSLHKYRTLFWVLNYAFEETVSLLVSNILWRILCI